MAVPSPTLPPATTTNCWLLGETDVIAVDPAGVTPRAQDGLQRTLEDAGLRVAAVLLTHHHGDHIGGARALAASWEAPILAHPWTAAHVGLPIDRQGDGEVLCTDVGVPWRLLHTPDTPRHLCATDRAHVIAGDMVAGEGTIVLNPPEGDLAQYLSSLEALKALAPDVLLPAHGPTITEAVSLIEDYIQHRNARTEQVLAALRRADGPRTARALVPDIYPDLPERFHGLAARQVLCHLLWLEDTHAALRDGGGWTCSPGPLATATRP